MYTQTTQMAGQTVFHRYRKRGPFGPLLLFREVEMKTTTNTTTTKPQLIIYGLDETGKPKAGRFTPSHADAAKEAAAAMKLTAIEATGPRADDILRKLSVGRIHARGKAFIPFIKRDLYDQICSVNGEPNAKGKEGPALSSPPIEQSLSTAKASQASALPRDWDRIDAGHMVLLQESLAAGWFEAIVISRDNESLTLRLRDYPKYPNFVRHIRTVALVHPGII